MSSVAKQILRHGPSDPHLFFASKNSQTKVKKKERRNQLNTQNEKTNVISSYLIVSFAIKFFLLNCFLFFHLLIYLFLFF